MLCNVLYINLFYLESIYVWEGNNNAQHYSNMFKVNKITWMNEWMDILIWLIISRHTVKDQMFDNDIIDIYETQPKIKTEWFRLQMTSTKVYVSLAQVFVAQIQWEQSWNTVNTFYKSNSNSFVVLLRRRYLKYKNP